MNEHQCKSMCFDNGAFPCDLAEEHLGPHLSITTSAPNDATESEVIKATRVVLWTDNSKRKAIISAIRVLGYMYRAGGVSRKEDDGN